MKMTARLFLFILFVATLVGFFLPNETRLDLVLARPGSAHWLGTDSLGRDFLLRILKGNFFSWCVGFLASAIAFIIGTGLGFCAGWRGRKVDFFVMRLIEILDSIPAVILVTLFVLLVREWTDDDVQLRVLALGLGVGLTHWMVFARITRVLVLQQSNSAFVEGAIAIGASPWRILRVHLIPHLWPTLRQSLWAQLPSFFLFESLLSFLGFGLQPPETSLGLLLQEGWKTFSISPHLLLGPGVLLFATLLCFQFGQSDSNPRGGFF